MGQSFFIWNGVDCRSMGIVMRAPAAIIRAEERIEHAEIPGRAGDLTITEGDNIYNSYIQTVSIGVRGGFRVREVYKWLRGSGYVTFSGEPDRRQKARVIGAITLNKHSRNLDTWDGECQFYCQPLKERLVSSEVQVASGGTVRNDGDVEARPRYRIKANATTAKVKITKPDGEEQEITLTGVQSGWWYLIDTDSMTVSNWDLQASQHNYTQLSSGDFPTLAVGANTLTGSGWSECHVIVRERFL